MKKSEFNPFIPFAIAAWAVFVIAYAVTQFKPWAWMLWAPYLTIATVAPIVWYVRNRRKV